MAPAKSVNINAKGHRTEIPMRLIIRLMLKVFDSLECLRTSITEKADVIADSTAKATPSMPNHVGKVVI